MDREEAKIILSNVLAELHGEESDRPIGEGVTSEFFVKDRLQEVYTLYFCKNRVLSKDNPVVELDVV